MAKNCYHCSKDLGLTDGQRPSRSETCPHCHADVYVCKNCSMYDTKAYNDCREPQADRVVDKEKRNFCDYFVLVGAHTSGGKAAEKNDALKKLDDLFK